jgi:hypothetical protein
MPEFAPDEIAAMEAQRQSWVEHENRSLDRGECPGSGAELLPRGDVAACAVCDCGGYPKEMIPDGR